MWRDERGVALPIVIALSTIMFLITTVTISQSLRSRQAENLHWEMIQASYAAEGGIAQVQAKLHAGSVNLSTLTLKVNRFVVQAQIQKVPLQITCTAYGRFGVKQRITAQLSSASYHVIRWIK